MAIAANGDWEVSRHVTCWEIRSTIRVDRDGRGTKSATAKAKMAATSARSCALIARNVARTTQIRSLSSTGALRADAATHVGVAPSPRKPVGGIRGG